MRRNFTKILVRTIYNLIIILSKQKKKTSALLNVLIHFEKKKFDLISFKTRS